MVRTRFSKLSPIIDATLVHAPQPTPLQLAQAAIDSASHSVCSSKLASDDYICSKAPLVSQALRATGELLTIRRAATGLTETIQKYEQLLSILTAPEAPQHAQLAGQYIAKLGCAKLAPELEAYEAELIAGTIKLGSSCVGYSGGGILASMVRFVRPVYCATETVGRYIIHALLPKSVASRYCLSPKQANRSASRTKQHEKHVLRIHRRRIEACNQPELLKAFDQLTINFMSP